ncbi:IS110 family transposase [Virgisporangium ochraceum]
MEIFCGIDWVTDDLAGFTALSAMLAEHGGEQFTAVDVAIETDRGLLVAALRAAGHRVFAINPKAVDRYRDRHSVSGAKSDPGDALVLAHLLRTDRDQHRPMPDDSELGQAVSVLARAHQDLIWARRQDANRLRSLLREFFPAALTAFTDLTTKTALTVLATAPTPTAAALLTRANLVDLLHAAGRGTRPAEAAHLTETFTAEELRQPAAVETAMGEAVRAIVRTLTATNESIRQLEHALAASFEQHPDAEIIDSLPGLGLVLGARVLGEFGDDPTRFTHAASRRNYAGTAPITRASGRHRAVLARYIRNKRLADACYLWAFAALTRSTGARSYYDRRRSAGDRHNAALRRPTPSRQQTPRPTPPLPDHPRALQRSPRLARTGHRLTTNSRGVSSGDVVDHTANNVVGTLPTFESAKRTRLRSGSAVGPQRAGRSFPHLTTD